MLNIIDSINKKYFPEFILSLNLISDLITTTPSNNTNQNKLNIHLQYISSYDFKNYNFIYNTEQLSIKKWIDIVYQLSYNYTILDYSLYNIQLLKNKNPSSYAIFFPILFDKNNMLFDKTLNNRIMFNKEQDVIDKLYDISFIGSLTERRIYIIDQLKNKGYKINIINDCYDLKDKYNKILSSKILLNIHAYNDYKIFEFARCSIPIFNSQIVISENSLDEELLQKNQQQSNIILSNIKKEDNFLELKDNITSNHSSINNYILDKVIFTEYDKLVDKIEEVINNIDKYEYKINMKELEYYNNKEINRLKNFFKSF